MVDSADRSSRPARRPWLVRNVVVLGIVSLLTDAASEMIVPLLPAFVTGVLGAGAFALGWIEGAADGVASVLKLVAGRWADRSGKNRPLVIVGYTISSVSRPFVALAATTTHVLGVRLLDRIGKGLRTSPRDMLIAGSVEPEHHGAAFGFHRAMDHAGAVVGPLLALLVLSTWTQDLRVLFWLSAIPGGLAVLVLVVGSREVRQPRGEAAASPLPTEAASASLRGFLVPLGLFTLGNASDVFLLLNATEHGAPLTSLPVLWLGLHVVKTATSIPGGHLADRWDRRKTIAIGWIVYAMVYVGFALAESQSVIWTLFIVYGLHHGLSEGPERALVAELAPAGRGGTSFGWYHLTLGALSMTASVLFGLVWEWFGGPVAFLSSAGLAMMAAALLVVRNDNVR